LALRLGVLATHPIQYQVPWFRALAAERSLDLTVFYCLLPNPRQQGVDFGVEFEWDVPLLDGYQYKVLSNVAAAPSLSTFAGCDTPAIGDAVDPCDAFIVNGWGTKSALQALWACRTRRVPCIVRGESNAFRPRAWPRRMAHRLLLRQYAACLSIGKANTAFYRGNGVPESKLFSGPYCVDNGWFADRAAALESDRNALRDRLRVPRSSYLLLFCAKFVEKKRPFDLLEALASAVQEPPRGRPLHLLMVGDGELRQRCEAIARERALPVSFSGFLNQQEIVAAYVAADCLVLPSDAGETWGLVVNEAMACGRPAIVSDRVGCHPDLVEPGVTGAVFPCGSVPAFAAALRECASDPEKSLAMGRNARGRVAQYSVQKLVAGTLAAVTATARPRAR
jgi:glycosyltransferase involved in cell wall biosynthesis